MTREPGDRIGPSKSRKVLQRRVDYLTDKIETHGASDDALAWDLQERKVLQQQIEAITGTMIPNDGDAFVVRRGLGDSARVVLVRDGRIVAELRISTSDVGDTGTKLRVVCSGEVVTAWGDIEPVPMVEEEDDEALVTDA